MTQNFIADIRTGVSASFPSVKKQPIKVVESAIDVLDGQHYEITRYSPEKIQFHPSKSEDCFRVEYDGVMIGMLRAEIVTQTTENGVEWDLQWTAFNVSCTVVVKADNPAQAAAKLLCSGRF